MIGKDRLTGTLYRHEVRMLLRDRRMVVLSIVISLVVMPLLLFSSLLMEERRQKRLEKITYTYAIVGSGAGFVRALITEADALGKEDGSANPNLEEKNVADPKASLAQRDIQFFVEATGLESGDPGSETQIPAVKISYQGNHDRSRTGARKMRELLESARESRRHMLLRSKGFPVDPEAVLPIREEDIATRGQVSGSTLGRFLTVMLMLFLFTGGSIVATDSIAGEKENGTLETLLTTAADRIEIVGAKLLAILSVALFITVTQVLNLLIYVGLGVIPLPENFVLKVPPFTSLVLFFLFFPLAVLTSGLLLMISGRAKTFKEAQLYFTPVLLIGALPGLAAVLPGIELRSAVVLVPIANTSVAVREILTGRFDWLFLSITWLVTATVAAWTLWATMRLLSVERLITAGDMDKADWTGGDALFQRHVLVWFGVIWVVILLVSLNLETDSPMVYQVLFNIVLAMGGGSFLMIRRYRLAPREALSLKAPKPAVWLGVLGGVPAGYLTAVGIFALANRIFPVPEEMLESFQRALVPQGVPLWQMLLFIAILPGIFEEIAFRGLLLHGLRRRFHPATLCVVVALIFGLFHTSLFRIIPTAFLGLILTAVTLLTGSIYPAMVWHGLNNGFGLLASSPAAPIESLGAPVFLGAVLVLALSFWIIYRNRTPYPDLRPWSRQ